VKTVSVSVTKAGSGDIAGQFVLGEGAVRARDEFRQRQIEQRRVSRRRCSPTRAALITGCNHHAVGFGVIAASSTRYPGYESIVGPENATIGRILGENGYARFVVWQESRHMRMPANSCAAANLSVSISDSDR
jgi:Sulfatase